MVRKKKLSKYLLISFVIHIILAVAMSVIYAEQPRKKAGLKIVSSVRVQYKEPEPPPEPKPKPKVVNKTTPKKVVPPKKKEPKVTPQKVEPPKVTTRQRRMNAPAPGVVSEKAPRRSRSAPGVAGLKGTRGTPGDRPGVQPSGGIPHPTLTTKTGGSGLSPGITHGSMQVPSGSSQIPSAGGREAGGFRMGNSRTGDGVGEVDVPGSGGTGGTGGSDVEGPGAGLSDIGRRNSPGGGKGTTGLGVGETSGMGEVDSEPGGGRPGGGGGGPGSGGYNATPSRSGPGLTNRTTAVAKGDKDLPQKTDLPEEKRAGATGKKDFKADLGKGMTGVNRILNEPTTQGFEDALQGEINKNLHSLRKIHEDWKNLKLPNVPKVLQITIELDTEKGKPKLIKADFHNPSLSSRISDDLTKKIREWKFESLFDGKDDPKKWPIKLSGKISWQ